MTKKLLLLAALAAGSWSLPVSAETSETHHVEISAFTFVPARIEVRQGDVVEWTNRDLVPHTATADDRGWDTGLIRNGAAGRLVAATPGTFAYHCKFHPQMTGIIVVAPAAAP